MLFSSLYLVSTSTVTVTSWPGSKSPFSFAAIASGEKPPEKVSERRSSAVFFFVGGRLGLNLFRLPVVPQKASGLARRRVTGKGKAETAQIVAAVGPADPEHAGDRIGANLVLFKNALDVLRLQGIGDGLKGLPGHRLAGRDRMNRPVQFFPLLFRQAVRGEATFPAAGTPDFMGAPRRDRFISYVLLEDIRLAELVKPPVASLVAVAVNCTELAVSTLADKAE